jgi:DNA-binding response OmpR family regulator
MFNKRLLIVEDDYDVAEMLLMYFAAHKFEVVHTDNGANGIELARTKFPNLILLDVMLPEMNGYDVCFNLRQIALTRHIPVIFLTQRDARADKVEGLQLGADDYIAKPFDVDELRLRVERSIDRATRESLHERRTGLPTGPMVDDEIERANRSNRNYHAYRLQLTGYEAFRDVYGFMSADQVIAFAARNIREAVSIHGTENDFVGIQGDEFLVMTYAADTGPLLEQLMERFDEGARAFYSFTDADQGGVKVNEGTADERIVPIMTLTPNDAGVGTS